MVTQKIYIYKNTKPWFYIYCRFRT